jgi:hypothetical protein
MPISKGFAGAIIAAVFFTGVFASSAMAQGNLQAPGKGGDGTHVSPGQRFINSRDTTFLPSPGQERKANTILPPPGQTFTTPGTPKKK